MTTTVPTPERIAELAAKAADIIERRGHCQHLLFDPRDGSMSFRGALALAVGLPPITPVLFTPMRRYDGPWLEFNTVDTALADFLGLVTTRDCNGGAYHDNRVIDWEDAPGRLPIEVTSALRGLAAANAEIAVLDMGEIDFGRLSELLG
jgi:hypothetical protein